MAHMIVCDRCGKSFNVRAPETKALHHEISVRDVSLNKFLVSGNFDWCAGCAVIVRQAIEAACKPVGGGSQYRAVTGCVRIAAAPLAIGIPTTKSVECKNAGQCVSPKVCYETEICHGAHVQTWPCIMASCESPRTCREAGKCCG